jgi:hypothetical protein
MVEIVGKTLLFGGLFMAVVSQLYIMAFVFKIKYRSAFSFIVLPTLALVCEDFRKSSKIRVSLKLCGASLPMVILGAYFLAVV